MKSKYLLLPVIVLILLAGCSDQKEETTTTRTQETTTTTKDIVIPDTTTVPTTSSTTSTTTSSTTSTTTTTSTSSTTLEGNSECIEVCEKKDYLAGVCRVNKFECRKRDEYPYESGGLCPDHRLDTCCCQSNESVKMNSTFVFNVGTSMD